MPIATCPPADQLRGYVLGTLSDVQIDTVAAHVQSCTVCESTISSLDGTRDSLLASLAQPSGDDQYEGESDLQRALAQFKSQAVTAISTSESSETDAHKPRETGAATPVAGQASSGFPETIREYRLVRELGRGGMGAVFLAQHTRLKRDVALKILAAELTGDPQALARFNREMEAVGRLEHPHIVRATDAGEHAGIHYLVMEYVPGETLSQIVRRHGPLPLGAACELIRQAAVGLQYVHEHGLIHRDIKPGNLMLAYETSGRKAVSYQPSAFSGQPSTVNNQPSALPAPQSAISPPLLKILDLGLARLHAGSESGSELTGAGQMMGTIDYMAPEQWGESHTADIRADLYGLGATLYKLLTGEAPFPDRLFKNRVTKMAAALGSPPEPITTRRSDCPAALVTLLNRLLAKDAADRPSTPAEVAAAIAPFCKPEELEQLLPGRAVEKDGGERLKAKGERLKQESTLPAAPPSSFRLSPSAFRPRRRIALVVAAAAILLAAFLVFRIATDNGEIVITTSDDDVEVTVRHVGKQTGEDLELTKGGDNKTKVRSGEVEVIIRGDNADGYTVSPKTVTLRRGDVEVVKIERKSAVATTPDVIEPAKSSDGWHGWPPDAPPPAIAPFDAQQANQHQEVWAKYLGVPVEYTNTLGMKFRLIPPGEFTMGSTPKEIEDALKEAGDDWHLKMCFKSEAPQHIVILTQPFYLGAHEVTQDQYNRVIGQNPSHFAPTGIRKDAVAGMDTTVHPVEMVSWDDTAEFCEKLNQHEKLIPLDFQTGETITPLESGGYRLPAEAEWEFSCRAGTTTRYWIGDKSEALAQAGWFGSNSGGRTHAVGELKANPFGLYDIHGNVWEWVQDGWEPTSYGRFFGKTAIDPNVPVSASSERVIRCGVWFNTPAYCRASLRNAGDPGLRNDGIGFRVSLPVDAARLSLKATGQEMPNRPETSVTDTSKVNHVVGEGRSPFDALDPAMIPEEERYDWQPKELVAVIGSHKRRFAFSAYSMAIRPDGQRIAVGTIDIPLASMFDLRGGRLLANVEANAAYGLAFSSDSRRLASMKHLFDLSGPLPQSLLPLPSGGYFAEACGFSPDGRRLLTRIYVGDQNESLSAQWLDVSGEKAELLAEIPNIYDVVMSPDGHSCAVSNRETVVAVYDLLELSVQQRLTLPSHPVTIAKSTHSPGRPLAFVGNGRLLTLFEEQTLCLWDVSGGEGKLLTSVKNELFNPPSLTVSPDGTKACAYNQGGFSIWAVDDQEMRNIPMWDGNAFGVWLSGNITAATFLPDNTLATGHVNGSIRLWNVSGEKMEEADPLAPQPLEWPYRLPLLLTPDGRGLITTPENMRPKLWQFGGAAPAEAEKFAEGLGDAASEHLALGISADGRSLITIPSNSAKFQQWSLAGDRLTPVFQAERDATHAAIHTAAINPAADIVATVSVNGIVSLFRLQNEKASEFSSITLMPGHMWNLAFANGGQTLIAKPRGGKILYLWDVTPQGLANQRALPLSNSGTGLAVSPDGRMFSASDDQGLQLWTLRNGQATKPDRFETGGEPEVAFDPTGKYIATVSLNSTTGTIMIWDVATGERLREIQVGTPVNRLLYTPDGRHLIAGNTNGTIYVLRLEQ